MPEQAVMMRLSPRVRQALRALAVVPWVCGTAVVGALTSSPAQAQVPGAAEAPAPRAFETCAPCHSLKPGEHLNGPSLHRLWQRPAGSVEGFRYSGPLKRSGIVWDAKTLKAFIADPAGTVPGNRMPYSGLEDPAELDRLVDYLQQVAGGSR